MTKLALWGSGEFTDTVYDIDNYLVEEYRPKSIAVIALAAGQEKDVFKWFELAKQHYARYNIQIIDIPIFNSQDANNQLIINKLKKADCLFFSGGNPNYLLSSLIDSLLLEQLIVSLKNDVLICGSSAGAMVMGNYILSNLFKLLFYKNNEVSWERALAVVDVTVFPHFNRLSTHPHVLQFINRRSSAKVNKQWLGIDENTAIFLNSSSLDYKVIGSGSIKLVDAHKGPLLNSVFSLGKC